MSPDYPRHAAIILAAGASRRLGTPKQLLRIDGQPLVRRTALAALATGPAQALVVVGAHADAVHDAVKDLGLQRLDAIVRPEESPRSRTASKGPALDVRHLDHRRLASAEIDFRSPGEGRRDDGPPARRRPDVRTRQLGASGGHTSDDQALNGRVMNGMSASLAIGLAALRSDIDAALVLVCDQPALDALHLHVLVDAWRKAPECAVASAYAGILGVPAVLPRHWFNAMMQLNGDQGARALLRERKDVRGIALPALADDIDVPQDLSALGLRT